ncbi:MAG: hypothetical protein K8E66_12310, partial [Phycisphaerales bacterium]|nr:hypothetical protein [Phycisphaerales bacterium]
MPGLPGAYPAQQPPAPPSGEASASAKDDDGKEDAKPEDEKKPKWDVVNAPLGPSKDVTLDTTEGTWMSLDVSPDGTEIVFDLFGDLFLMPITGGEAKALSTGPAWDMQPRFSPDGKRIVTSSLDGTARVWDATSGQELVSLEGYTGEMSSAAFSPDGSRIVTAGRGSNAVWDSVSYRVRYAEREALLVAQPAAERMLADVLSRSSSLFEAERLLRKDLSLEPIVRRAALDLLLLRSSAAHEKTRSLEAQRAERRWVARMLGLEPWPNEGEVDAALRADA